MVAKRHKITNVPLFKKLWDIIFFCWDNHFMSHFSGHFEGASTFLTPKACDGFCMMLFLSMKWKVFFVCFNVVYSVKHHFFAEFVPFHSVPFRTSECSIQRRTEFRGKMKAVLSLFHGICYGNPSTHWWIPPHSTWAPHPPHHSTHWGIPPHPPPPLAYSWKWEFIAPFCEYSGLRILLCNMNRLSRICSSFFPPFPLLALQMQTEASVKKVHTY